jgi:sugar phosphate isomerase/epimerase
VKPDRVREELPKVVRAIRSHGLQVPLITTDVLRADDVAIATFETAASLDIREIKLGYHKYAAFGTFRQTLDQMRRDLDGVEARAKRLNLRANLHIHSGDHMTAQAAIVWDLIRDRDPRAIGAYVDPGHMFTEGGRDGWRQGLDLLGDRIAMVAVKDVVWEPDDSRALTSSPGTPGEGRGEGLQSEISNLKAQTTNAPHPNPCPEYRERGQAQKTRWRVRVVPLRKGIVDWPHVFACLRALKFDGWISIHSEYAGLGAEEVLTQTQDDLHYLRQTVGL